MVSPPRVATLAGGHLIYLPAGNFSLCGPSELVSPWKPHDGTCSQCLANTDHLALFWPRALHHRVRALHLEQVDFVPASDLGIPDRGIFVYVQVVPDLPRLPFVLGPRGLGPAWTFSWNLWRRSPFFLRSAGAYADSELLRDTRGSFIVEDFGL